MIDYILNNPVETVAYAKMATVIISVLITCATAIVIVKS